MAVVVLGYGIYPNRLPLIGEELCRAQHGIEMVESGDWVVATNQYRPILDRPPMQYWTLAAIHKWIHVLDPLTLRLSMMFVTLITSLTIWWYARRMLSVAGALLAAIAYPTMGHVFDLGRRVETDGQFTLLMSASLLVWHYGYARRWAPQWTWIASCTVAAMATLTKGSQAPIAFFGTIYLFLLIRREWRSLFHWAHLVGVAVYLGLIAIWQIPFYLRTGWEGTFQTWLKPYTSRVEFDSGAFVLHLVSFPLVVLAACLPWSALLGGLGFRGFWRLDDRGRSSVVFMLTGMATIFAPVWISVEGEHRYVMPMYPLMAVVCGAVLQQILASDAASGLRAFWRHYVRTVIIVLIHVVVILGAATVVHRFGASELAERLSQSWGQWTAMALVVLFGSYLAFGRAASARPTDALVATVTLGAMLSVCSSLGIQTVRSYDRNDPGPAIVALRDRLPADVNLVSFGTLNHRFVYWYETPVPVLPEPKGLEDVPDDLDYFAIWVIAGETEVDLPFEWEEIATLDMDRKSRADDSNLIVVGRRVGANR